MVWQSHKSTVLFWNNSLGTKHIQTHIQPPLQDLAQGCYQTSPDKKTIGIIYTKHSHLISSLKKCNTISVMSWHKQRQTTQFTQNSYLWLLHLVTTLCENEGNIVIPNGIGSVVKDLMISQSQYDSLGTLKTLFTVYKIWTSHYPFAYSLSTFLLEKR